MITKNFSILLSLIVALLFSLAIPVRVIADETPPPPTEEPVLPPTDIPEPIGTEPTMEPTEEAAPPPATEQLEPAPTEELSVDPVDILPSTEEPLLAVLPEDTSVIVLVDGEIEPLVTQAAQATVLVGDPIWCPEAVLTPTANSFGCTDSYLTLEALIDDILIGNIVAPSQDGIIWITGNDTSVAPVVIDGSDAFLATWSNYSLTIQGGWSGGPNTTVSGNSIFSVPITVENWNADVTVNNLTFNNVGNTALLVETIDADISISNIVSTNNAGAGNNGVDLTVNDTLSVTGGSVTVDNLTANGNGGTGLTITGLVTTVDLLDVIASNNGESGIFIEATGDVDAENITASGNDTDGMNVTSSGGAVSVLGTNLFENNNENGLYIDSNGDVDLENISANNNGAGAILGNGVEVTSATGTVTISGTNVFNNNLNNGLLLEAGVDANVENITASQNGQVGADLNVIGSASILGTNLFENNTGLGLYVEADADIDTQDLTATANGVELYAGGSIFMNGTNVFTDNLSGTGLYAEAAGEIDAENISASNNAGVGAELLAQGNVTLSGINVFQQNTGSGLYAQSLLTGDVNVEGLTSDNNGGVGAELYANTGNIFILGTNLFTNNGSEGLYADTGGNISAQNLDASGNGTDGVDLVALGNVTLAGTNVFELNSQTGLYIEALGNIQAENITSNSNLTGVILDAGGSINVTGTNQFSNNTVDGIQVQAIGDIYIENADAQNNGGLGMFLDTKGNAQVVCSIALGNGGYEIEADTTGTLTLAGTDFGNDIDNNLNVDEDLLILISNGCFVYPPSLFDSESEDDDDDDSDDEDLPAVFVPPLPISTKTDVDRQVVGLSCDTYSGTKLVLINGDNVYIPCPIIDSARLIGVPLEGLTAKLSESDRFVSGFILDLYTNGQLVGSGGESGLIDFSTINPSSASAYSYVYWDGSKWVEVTDQSFPYMGLFFVTSEDMMNKDLAILYWDGSDWVELKDDAQFGQGRKVGKGGYFVKIDGQLYYSATVNFTGLFVLVER